MCNLIRQRLLFRIRGDTKSYKLAAVWVKWAFVAGQIHIFIWKKKWEMLKNTLDVNYNESRKVMMSNDVKDSAES